MTVDNQTRSNDEVRVPWSGMQVPRQRRGDPGQPAPSQGEDTIFVPTPPPVFPRVFPGI